MSASLEVLGPAVDPWVAGAVAVALTGIMGIAWRRLSLPVRGALVLVVVVASESALRSGPPTTRDSHVVDLRMEAGGCESPHHTLELHEPTHVRFFVERPRVVALGGAFRVVWPGHPREIVVRATRLIDKPCGSVCEDGASCFAGRCVHRAVDLLRPLEEATDDHVLHPHPAWVESWRVASADEGRRWWEGHPCTACHVETSTAAVGWHGREPPPPSRLLDRFDSSHRLGTCPLAKHFGEVSPYFGKSLELYLGAAADAAGETRSSRVSLPRGAATDLVVPE